MHNKKHLLPAWRKRQEDHCDFKDHLVYTQFPDKPGLHSETLLKKKECACWNTNLNGPVLSFVTEVSIIIY